MHTVAPCWSFFGSRPTFALFRACRSLSLSLAAALVFAFTASPQSPAAPSPGPTPSITANADEVSLDLVVRNRHNRPVVDLSPSDLLITDNGSPVTLSGLH